MPRTKTGINVIDNLSDEEYFAAVRDAKKRYAAMTPEERVRQMGSIYEIHRQKLIEHGGMISQQQALEEFLNKDFPEQVESMAKEMESAAVEHNDKRYLEIANHLRTTRWGIDQLDFEVNLIPEDDDTTQVGVSFTVDGEEIQQQQQQEGEVGKEREGD